MKKNVKNCPLQKNLYPLPIITGMKNSERGRGKIFGYKISHVELVSYGMKMVSTQKVLLCVYGNNFFMIGKEGAKCLK